MTPPFHWELKLQQMDDKTSGRHIPPDIIFKIQEEGVIHDLFAHKMVMGMVSPVFYDMFFLADVKAAKELYVEGTTLAAFSIMRNCIYNVWSLEDSLWGKSVTEVFAVLDLVSRYKISELQHIVLDHIYSFPLTDDSVLSVACDAMRRPRLELGALELLRHCAEFIKPKLSEAQAVFHFQYLADHVDHKEVVYELLVLMKDLDSQDSFQLLDFSTEEFSLVSPARGDNNEEIRMPEDEELDEFVLDFGGRSNKELGPRSAKTQSSSVEFGSPASFRINKEQGTRSLSFDSDNRDGGYYDGMFGYTSKSYGKNKSKPSGVAMGHQVPSKQFTPKTGFITKSKEKRQLFGNQEMTMGRADTSKPEGINLRQANFHSRVGSRSTAKGGGKVERGQYGSQKF